MTTIYLDHAATTPLRPEVFRAMEPHLGSAFGNPSSAHRYGRRARRALENARERLAAALGTEPGRVVFVRGGTEGDNLAISGVLNAVRETGRVPAVAHTPAAHSAIVECAEYAERLGATRRTLGVSSAGQIDLDALDHALARGLDLVSVLWVNNETGVVLPVEQLQQRVRSGGATLHVDAVQAVGKIPVDLTTTPVDILVLTGHKLGGPTGTGALVRNPDVKLAPMMYGGSQEHGIRPGTEDVAGAVGLATAVDLAVREQPHAAEHMESLRDHLEDSLAGISSQHLIHGGGAARAPHISNVGFPGVPRDAVLAGLDMESVAVSGGSACSSGSVTQSRVIKALYGDEYDAAAVRFSLARSSTRAEVDQAVARTARVLGRLDAERYGSALANTTGT